MTDTITAAPDSRLLIAIRSVGGVLPADLIASVVAGRDLAGLGGADYHLELDLTPREAANRAWTVLRGAWAAYQDALSALPAGQATTGLTRERWLLVLLRELGFGRVPTAPTGGISADGRSWSISHLAAGNLPVHLLGWGVELDRRTPGLAGAAERAPHAMVQELLNRSDDYLWGLLSNGGVLRVLRDSSALVGPSYVEFDLAAIFDGELFSDFVALYLLCHQSRFEPTDPEIGTNSCWLERWRTHAVETGTRALGALRLGVHEAIETLGTGLVAHPANASLRNDLEAGRLSLADFQRGLLRLVYRILFCFVAEDRDLLLDPSAPAEAKATYTQWFSTSRLRRIATRRAGDNHCDQWQALRLVLSALSKEQGCPQLGLAGLGGIFEDGPQDLHPDLLLDNRHLLGAIRHLCVTRPEPGGPRRLVDYRNLGAEELGGIYESLLEYSPSYDHATRSFHLQSVAGSERKKTGAYYTPTSLTEALLDSALDPLLERAEKQPDPQGALLSLAVCDPACGSGHFLVAAGRRIARRLAALRAEGAEPTVEQIHTAMHDVVGRCLFGVDVNPLAAELAKVSLWLEGTAAGRPLGLLDGHIKVGNALLGATPALLAGGIPDEAFAVIEGDDKKTANGLKRRNKTERAGARQLGEEATAPFVTTDIATAAREIEVLVPRDLADVHVAAQRLRDLEGSPEARLARLVADAWCSAFVLPKTPGAPQLTHSQLMAIAAGRGSPEILAAVEAVSARYRWFHWHIEFPTIFGVGGPEADPTAGWSGGFDCVIGNPPWERVKLQQQEWFASRVPAVAEAPNASARKKLIAALEEEHPEIHSEYLVALRHAEGESHFIRDSGRYPLAGRGDINTYAVFAEGDRSLVAPTGRLGVILPTGVATDATTQHFFKDLVTSKALVSLYDFENSLPLFEGVHRSFKFCLLTLTGRAVPAGQATFSFFAHHPDDLRREGAVFALTPEEITLLNPNTGTCPVFRSRRDAEITLAIYRRHPVLVRHGDPNGNPWGLSFMTMFHMSNDSGLFRTRQELQADGWSLQGNTFRLGDQVMLPLYEAKMIHHFDHRWATYDGSDIRDVTEAEHADPGFVVQPRYWVPAGEVADRLADRWDKPWLLGFRDITNTTNERTMIAGAFPPVAVGNKVPLLLPSQPHLLGPALSSLILDYSARQKVGGTTMNFFYVEQLPVPRPEAFSVSCPWSPGQTIAQWVESRVLELTYTAWDMKPFAESLGDDGPPFVWDPNRRATLRAELDAAFFHLYGIDRDDTEYILGTFPIANRRDPGLARRVLDAYDSIAKSIDTGDPFTSTLDPTPGQGPRHPSRP
jgi:hypothetical protein